MVRRLRTLSSVIEAQDGNGLFQQSGGTNAAGVLAIGAKGGYELSGGGASVARRLDSNGVLDPNTPPHK
jgi:hypothetical protein